MVSDGGVKMNSDTVKIKVALPEEKGAVIRILLSEAASRHLDVAGPQAFAIVSRDMSDERTGRWVISLAPVEWETARDASAVLVGSAKAVRPKPAATPPLTKREIRTA